MGLTIWGRPNSVNVQKALWCLAELDIAYERIDAGMQFGRNNEPDYLAMNPNGRVPTLVDGDFVLTESRSIMQYLASKKPESGLLPRDEAARADVTRWQFWDAAHFSPQMGTLAFEKVLKGMMGLGEPDGSKVQEALNNFRRFAAVLNKRLEGKKYVVGNALTIADLTLASSLMYAKQVEIPLAEFPNVQAWFSRISELDGWKKTSG